MNNASCAAVVAATLGASVFSVSAAELSVEKGNVYDRWTDDYDGLSGITYAGGNSYYIVCDNGSRHGIYSATINLSADGKTITSFSMSPNPVVPAGTTDNEGIAYDPSTGNVWVTDEDAVTVKEYNPATGDIIQSLDVNTVKGGIMKKYRRPNNGLEALTISGDGLTLWTCNEEALTVDGPNSSMEHPTTVRLVRYTRPTVSDKFRFASMHPYTTDTWTLPENYRNKARCGVAGLCALPDGSLLVLERELSFDGWDSVLGWKLYRVAFPCWATNVSDYPSLENSSWEPATKKILESDGDDLFFAGNFEGICLGPKLPNGRISLLLVSDAGDGYSPPQLYPLVLKGMEIHTLNIPKPFVGAPTVFGQNLRFLDGLLYGFALRGEGIEPTAYTNRGDLVYSSWWSLPAHGKSGTGPFAIFKIDMDDTLIWNVSHMPTYANTPISLHDTFEKYELGDDASDVRYWNGECEVVSGTPPSSKWILKNDKVHQKVLDVEAEATRSLPNLIAEDSRLDLLVQVKRPVEDLEPLPSNVRIAVATDRNGRLRLWHYGRFNGQFKAEWSLLRNTVYADGTWVRVSVEFTYKSDRAYGLVRVNGTVCDNIPGCNSSASLNSGSGSGKWVPMPNRAVPQAMTCCGTKVDDLILATKAYMTTLDASASIVVAPGEAGGAESTGPTFTVAVAVPAAAAPVAARPRSASPTAANGTAELADAVSAPAITGFGLTADSRPRIRFTGFAEGAVYRVVRSASLDFKGDDVESLDGDVMDNDNGVAVWEGKSACDPSAGAKFYRIEVVSE